MRRNFENKPVLITGAGSGIGRAPAIAFAQAGASLELVDVAREGLERTAASCRERGRGVHTHVGDVADASAMAALADRVHARIAALDVLMNNAGVGVAGDFVGTELAGQAGFQERIAEVYERRNYGPDRAASAVLEAVRKRQKVVPVAPEAWAMYYGKRLSPALMELLMGRDAPV